MPTVIDTTEKKQAVRKFWGTRPCGVIHSKNPVESPEFFQDTEAYRFRIHTDWNKPFLKDAIGFDKHTGKFMLEVGSGIGVDSLEWKRYGNRVISLDYNFPSCRLTRSRLEDAGYDGAYLNGDAENLPFPDATFDLVYSFGVLHHTPDTPKTIREVYRCLKPGGEAIIMLYYKWSAKVLGEILLGFGLRKGALFQLRSMQELINQYTEFDSQFEGNICPLTQVFSKREIRKMFNQFEDVSIDLHYLWPGHYGPARHLLPLVPKGIRQNLPSRMGWNAVIKAVKK